MAVRNGVHAPHSYKTDKTGNLASIGTEEGRDNDT